MKTASTVRSLENPHKKQYQAPVVTVYGDLRDLTQVAASNKGGKKTDASNTKV